MSAMVVVEPAAKDDATLSAASSSKRAAPSSDGATAGPPHSRRRRSRDSSSSGPTAPFAALSRLAQWSGVLRVRSGHPGLTRTRSGVEPGPDMDNGKGKAGASNGDDEMELDQDLPVDHEPGSVTLSAAEVADLVAAIEANLDGPASKRDLLSLVLGPPSSSRSSLSHSGVLPPHLWRSGSGGPKIKTPPLPTDCLLLIFDELRHLRATTEDENPWITRTGRYTGWRGLRKMSFVCKAWRDAARPLYLSELHIEQTRELPLIAERLRSEPGRGELLTRLFIKVYGFEAGRSTDDAGFALPEILAHVPNLRVLELTSDRLYSGRTGRTPPDVMSFTGVHLPTTIATSVPLLRTLSYGLSCTLSDIQIFTTQLPELRSLDVTGDVPDGAPTIAFKACPPSLRRLWLPTATLTTQQLQRLLSSGSRVQSLGFTFDLDESLASQPASEDKAAASLAKLVALFERVGSSLRELLVAAPYGDLPELGPRLRLPGGWGGGGVGVGGAIQIAFQTIQHIAPLGPLAVGAPPPAAPSAGPVLAPIAAAGAPAAAAAAGRGRRIAPLPAPAAAPAAAAGGGAPAPAPPFPFAFPFAATNPTPFFEPLVAECPSLVHLELYGRRYPASIFEHLKVMPLEHLALSVPLDAERAGVVDALVDALEADNEDTSVGLWKGLRRLELNGRGGEWEAAERRRIKVACQPRRITYASIEHRN